MKRVTVFILSALLLLSSCTVITGGYSELFYIDDGADVISTETEKYITDKNDSLCSLCGGQIVILTVKTTGDADIGDYATNYFNKKKIGDKDKNNGFLLVMSIDEDDYHAVQGTGFEKLLSSGTIKLLLGDYLEPKFAVGDYDGGARALFDALLSEYENIYGITVK